MHRQRRLSKRSSIGLAVVVVCGVIGGLFVLLAPRSHQPPSLPRTAPSVAPASPQVSVPPKVAAAIPRSQPVRLIIPSIGVNAPIVPVGTDSSGALQTPPLSVKNEVGWYDGWGSNAPGQVGPAVIVGHVDDPTPAVFWDLHKLVPGQSVEVVLADGAHVWFTVTALPQTVSKGAFPTQQVYGPTSAPTLRLITCTGDFNQTSGHYTDNLIVYLTESVPTG